MTEHERKYEALAHTIGVAALRAIVPDTTERIAAALASGDEHLNTIPLVVWDRAAQRVNCGWVAEAMGDFLMRFNPPFVPKVANRLSLAERVCVLKHVAKYHMEGRGAK